MSAPTFATIIVELSKAGLHAYCEELDEDVFCVGGDLNPLVRLINDAEGMCSPDTVFRLTPKGKRLAKRQKEKGGIEL